jgi:hypothetical protein
LVGFVPEFVVPELGLVAEGDADGLDVGLPLPVSVGVGLPVSVGVGLPVGVGDPVGDTLGDGDSDGDTDGLAVGEAADVWHIDGVVLE